MRDAGDDAAAARAPRPALPDDPALPGLAWLSRRAARGRTFETVKHRPGKRMVVRERDGSGAMRVFWKLYDSDRGERSLALHLELQRLAAEAGLAFAIPGILGYWSEGRLLALRAAAGRPIAGLEGDALRAACAAAGRALASLHGSHWQPGREWTLRDEATTLDRACAALEDREPGLGARAGSLRDAIARAWLGEPGPGGAEDAWGCVPAACPVPLHRDFHPGQVLHAEGLPPMVLDWDDAARGPAEIDVGNFAAHLRLEAVRAPRRAAEWLGAEREFTDAYFGARALTPWPWLGRFVANTLLRLAGIAAERRGDLAEAQRLIEASAAELTAGRGEGATGARDGS